MGGSNAEKWGDLQRKKFFINNFIEALNSFKEEHQGLLKLSVPVGGGELRCGEKWEKSPKEGIFFEAEK